MKILDDNIDYGSDEYSDDDSSINTNESEKYDDVDDESLMIDESAPATRAQMIDEDGLTVVSFLNAIDVAVDAVMDAIIPNQNQPVQNAVEKDLNMPMIANSSNALVGVFLSNSLPANDRNTSVTKNIPKKNGMRSKNEITSASAEKSLWPALQFGTPSTLDARNVSVWEKVIPSVIQPKNELKGCSSSETKKVFFKCKKDTPSSKEKNVQANIWSFPSMIASVKEVQVHEPPERKKGFFKGKKNSASHMMSENAREKNTWSFASLMNTKEENPQPLQKKRGLFKNTKKNTPHSSTHEYDIKQDFWSLSFISSKPESNVHQPPEKKKGIFGNKKASSNNLNDMKSNEENDFWDNILNLVSPEIEQKSNKYVVQPKKNVGNRKNKSNHSDERDDILQDRNSILRDLRA